MTSWEFLLRLLATAIVVAGAWLVVSVIARGALSDLVDRLVRGRPR